MSCEVAKPPHGLAITGHGHGVTMKRVRIVSLLFGILLTFSVVESEASPL
jgi:hypothetical protein